MYFVMIEKKKKMAKLNLKNSDHKTRAESKHLIQQIYSKQIFAENNHKFNKY